MLDERPADRGEHVRRVPDDDRDDDDDDRTAAAHGPSADTVVRAEVRHHRLGRRATVHVVGKRTAGRADRGARAAVVADARRPATRRVGHPRVRVFGRDGRGAAARGLPEDSGRPRRAGRRAHAAGVRRMVSFRVAMRARLSPAPRRAAIITRTIT